MIETILTQEKELGKIRDHSSRQMAQIYLRAHLIAQFSLDEKNTITLLQSDLPPVAGLLGEAFHLHMKECLQFFLDNDEFKGCYKRLLAQDEKIATEYKKALLIPLRQTVGSCFATALLIHLQKADLSFLAKDIYQSFVKKRMSRIINGDEIKIPLCPKIGKAINCSPLMKSYEFTAASLADIQVGFSKWNFHEALGLDHEAEGGLGKLIYDLVDKRLKDANLKIEEMNQDIEDVERSLDMDDANFRSSTSMDRMNSIKRGAQGKKVHLNRMYGEVDDEAKSTQHLSTLYKFFVEQYIALFPHYFQELYDPEMFGEGDIEEDRPSGFRLVYKHGRSDPKAWTYITSDKEYIQSLFDFITTTEPILTSLKRDEGLERDIESIITELLLAIETPDFLKEQQERIAQMHKKHLKEENNISPYAYLAGGNLKSMIQTFYLSNKEVRQERIRCQDPLDLCNSIIEFMKDVKNLDVEPFEKDPFATLLICNDTHAFNLLPGQAVLKKAWMYSGNTYTYIRDVLMKEKEPIIFADTNWRAQFLAFVPKDDETGFELVLYDGFEAHPFKKWDEMFFEDAHWEIYL